jgi:CubicO group peptidase (beta-lactamase class C family)
MRGTGGCLAALLLTKVLVVPVASAQGTAGARINASAQEGRGFSQARLARMDTVLKRYTDSDSIAGLVAFIWRDGKPVYEKAFGWADREASRKMTTDAMFRIASQSKAITTVAILILVEEGKLAIGDPVSRYLPTFARTTVALASDSGRTPVPARRQVTIRDLLTHTAGISYGTDARVAERYRAQGLGPAAGAGVGFYTADKDEPICETMDRLGTLPFVAHPGDAWVYGYNTDILGCVVERVSGKPLDEFIRTRITAPLKMVDTYFFVPESKRGRLTAVYGSGPDGKAVRGDDGPRGQGHYVTGPRKSFAGGAGLVSTARDYARFLEMLRNEGVLDGARILSPAMVRLMHSNLTGALYRGEGWGFGLGFEIVERYGVAGPRSVGSYGWAGAYSTWSNTDPKERLVLVIMLQLVPNRTSIADRFPMMVYQALTPTP